MLSAARKSELKAQADQIVDILSLRYALPAINNFDLTEEERQFVIQVYGTALILEGGCVLGNNTQIPKTIMASLIADFFQAVWFAHKSINPTPN